MSKTPAYWTTYESRLTGHDIADLRYCQAHPKDCAEALTIYDLMARADVYRNALARQVQQGLDKIVQMRQELATAVQKVRASDNPADLTPLQPLLKKVQQAEQEWDLWRDPNHKWGVTPTEPSRPELKAADYWTIHRRLRDSQNERTYAVYAWLQPMWKKASALRELGKDPAEALPQGVTLEWCDKVLQGFRTHEQYRADMAKLVEQGRAFATGPLNSPTTKFRPAAAAYARHEDGTLTPLTP